MATATKNTQAFAPLVRVDKEKNMDFKRASDKELQDFVKSLGRVRRRTVCEDYALGVALKELRSRSWHGSWQFDQKALVIHERSIQRFIKRADLVDEFQVNIDCFRSTAELDRYLKNRRFETKKL